MIFIWFLYLGMFWYMLWCCFWANPRWVFVCWQRWFLGRGKVCGFGGGDCCWFLFCWRFPFSFFLATKHGGFVLWNLFLMYVFVYLVSASVVWLVLFLLLLVEKYCRELVLFRWLSLTILSWRKIVAFTTLIVGIKELVMCYHSCFCFLLLC